MKIHEYQTKEVLRQYAIPTPRGKACFSVEEAVAAATEIVRACKTFSTRRINEFRETSGRFVASRSYEIFFV